VTTNPTVAEGPHHPIPFPVIADSGANYHMFCERSFFDTLHPASGAVLLGDGITTLSIKGVGTVKSMVGSFMLTISNVQCIPELSESIYSLFQHIQTPDHHLESSYEDGLFIIFPTFCTKAIIGTDDIYLDFHPITVNNSDVMSDYTSIDSPSLEKCSHIPAFQKQMDQEISSLDHLLQTLRDYFNVVKTKRQLGFDVPAGFRRDNTHNQNYSYATPPRKSNRSRLDSLDSSTEPLINLVVGPLATTPVHSNAVSDPFPPMPSSNPPMYIPIVHAVDKVSSSLPKVITM
jgi:hypothetical protein